MRNAAFIVLLGVPVACWSLTARAQDVSDTNNVQSGRTLALKVCTPCHVVLPDQEFPPVFNGPPKPASFQAIADSSKTTEHSLRNFLSTTHSTISMPIRMPNPRLSNDQAAKIVSFMLSLRKR
jgi:mono/diheme cytochrome c family protein